MNYNKWSAEYLSEAEKIKERIGYIKTEVKAKNPNERRNKLHRINILYDMYLDCLHIGKYLGEREQHYET